MGVEVEENRKDLFAGEGVSDYASSANSTRPLRAVPSTRAAGSMYNGSRRGGGCR